MKLLKVLNEGKISPFREMEYVTDKEYICKDFDNDPKNECSRGFYAVNFNGLSYMYKSNREIYECEVSGKSVEIDCFYRRYEKITLLKKMTENEIKTGLLNANKTEGYNVYESIFPVNPLLIDRKNIDYKKLLKQWISIRTNSYDFVGETVYEAVCRYIRNSKDVYRSVCDSVYFLVFDSIFNVVYKSICKSISDTALNPRYNSGCGPVYNPVNNTVCTFNCASICRSVYNPIDNIIYKPSGVSTCCSVYNPVHDPICCSIYSMGFSPIYNTMYNSIYSSVRSFVIAYIFSLFPNIKKWKNIKYKKGENPFLPAINLWRAGYVPSFDGEIWRLHAGTQAEIIYERKGEN